MIKKDANEWIENTFSDWTKEEDRQESIFYLVEKIFRDFENRNCSNCKYWKYKDDVTILETCNFGLIHHSYRPDSFSCNKWEHKE